MVEDSRDSKKEVLDAVFIYGGILDAYEAVGAELIGENVVEEHVIPKMVYYVKEFLPEIFSAKTHSPDKLSNELNEWLSEFKSKIEKARELGSGSIFTMNEIWQLRAAIFGYESVFIDILGEAAIKNYVFKRIADILSSYLPDSFIYKGDQTLSNLEDKLKAYINNIKSKKFVEYANYRIKDDQVIITANRCEFSKIHDSEAYRNANVRFCPWGMIGSAILTSHQGKETTIDSCLFTTKGSKSTIISK
ncbi:MAG: hypothetical protein ACXAC6_03805 [Candidatus Hodarchaeales archaeon]